MEKVAERIREMSRYFDEEHIARALRIPVEVVRGVLSGEVPDEALEGFDPRRPPDVRFVEKERFVRARLVGLASTGGCGASTVAAALALLAGLEGVPSAAVDLSQNAGLCPALGVEPSEEAFAAAVSFFSGDGAALSRHPRAPDLAVVPGLPALEGFRRLDLGSAVKAVKDLAAARAMTFVDCPPYPLWEAVFPELDLVLFVVRADAAALAAFERVVPGLKERGLLARSAVVLNYLGLPGKLSEAECRKFLRGAGVSVAAALPWDEEVEALSSEGRTAVLDAPRSPFVAACRALLEALRGEAVRYRSRGLLDFLGRWLA